MSSSYEIISLGYPHLRFLKNYQLWILIKLVGLIGYAHVCSRKVPILLLHPWLSCLISLLVMGSCHKIGSVQISPLSLKKLANSRHLIIDPLVYMQIKFLRKLFIKSCMPYLKQIMCCVIPSMVSELNVPLRLF